MRLVGVSVGNLHAKAFQLTLDDGWKEAALYESVDRVRAKYGSRSIRLAGAGLAPVSRPALAAAWPDARMLDFRLRGYPDMDGGSSGASHRSSQRQTSWAKPPTEPLEGTQ